MSKSDNLFENLQRTHNVYDEQFAARIDKLANGSEQPSPPPTTNGSNEGNGWVGILGFLIVIGILRGCYSSESSKPPPKYTVPDYQVPKFDSEQFKPRPMPVDPIILEEIRNKDKAMDPNELIELLKKRKRNSNPGELPKPRHDGPRLPAIRNPDNDHQEP